MKRREFITLVGGAVAWPVGTRAQQAAMPMIGVLTMGSPEEANPDIEAAFERSLAERGYVVGRNVTIERRWARGNYDRLPELAQELVRLNPALIVVGGNVVTLAARRATSTIPIVFNIASDPVKLGLAKGFDNETHPSPEPLSGRMRYRPPRKVSAMSNPKTEPTDNTQKNPDEWLSGDDPMTGAQASFLNTLCEQAGMPDQFDENLTKAAASKLIDEMRKKPHVAVTKEEPMAAQQRDEIKRLCHEADVPDRSGELLTKEGAQQFIDDLQQQIAERKQYGKPSCLDHD
jgi:hypothetical protein